MPTITPTPAANGTPSTAPAHNRSGTPGLRPGTNINAAAAAYAQAQATAAAGQGAGANVTPSPTDRNSDDGTLAEVGPTTEALLEMGTDGLDGTMAFLAKANMAVAGTGEDFTKFAGNDEQKVLVP